MGLLCVFTVRVMERVLARDWDSSALTGIYLLWGSNSQDHELYVQSCSVIALFCICYGISLTKLHTM